MGRFGLTRSKRRRGIRHSIFDSDGTSLRSTWAGRRRTTMIPHSLTTHTTLGDSSWEPQLERLYATNVAVELHTPAISLCQRIDGTSRIAVSGKPGIGHRFCRINIPRDQRSIVFRCALPGNDRRSRSEHHTSIAAILFCALLIPDHPSPLERSRYPCSTGSRTCTTPAKLCDHRSHEFIRFQKARNRGIPKNPDTQLRVPARHGIPRSFRLAPLELQFRLRNPGASSCPNGSRYERGATLCSSSAVHARLQKRRRGWQGVVVPSNLVLRSCSWRSPNSWTTTMQNQNPGPSGSSLFSPTQIGLNGFTLSLSSTSRPVLALSILALSAVRTPTQLARPLCHLDSICFLFTLGSLRCGGTRLWCETFFRGSAKFEYARDWVATFGLG